MYISITQICINSITSYLHSIIRTITVRKDDLKYQNYPSELTIRTSNDNILVWFKCFYGPRNGKFLLPTELIRQS